MPFPIHRPRRLRQSESIRRLVRETDLRVDDLIAPLFVCAGSQVRQEVVSMPGVFQMSVDAAVAEAELLRQLRIPAALLFGVPERARKDSRGSEAWSDDGLVQRHLLRLAAVVDVQGLVHGIEALDDDGDVRGRRFAFGHPNISSTQHFFHRPKIIRSFQVNNIFTVLIFGRNPVAQNRH